jgi:hypothetical protein
MECLSELNEIRMIIDTEKRKLYVFNPELLHLRAAKVLNIKYEETNKNFIYSVGIMIPMSIGFVYKTSPKEERKMKKLKWLNKYFKLYE